MAPDLPAAVSAARRFKAISEGYYRKIQALKAAARGFRSAANERIRVPFFWGKTGPWLLKSMSEAALAQAL